MNAGIVGASAALLILALASSAVLAEEKTTAETVKEKASEAVEATREGTKKAARVVAQKTRQAWKRTKAYFSEDAATYREGATGQLKELGSEIARLKEQSANDRDYFATRVHALEQQHQYAQDQLAGLSAEELKSAKEIKRRKLSQVIDRLEENIDLAQKEAKDFAASP
jgi:hypothetical protein